MAERNEGDVLEADDTHQDEEHSIKDGRHERPTTVRRRHGQITREQFLAMVSASNPQPRNFHSQQANMMQLYQTLINLYLPIDADQRPLMSILTIAPSSRAIFSAANVICALILHRISGEPRILPSVISFYSDALRLARQEAIDPKTDKCTMIGTVHLLSVCELFQRVSLDDAGTTRPHARWLVSFMEKHRDDVGNERIQRFRDSNMRLVATWEMLIARSYRGTALRHGTELSAGTITTMSDLTLLTSSLLEESDNLCGDCGRCPASVLDTLQRIVSLEGILHKWLVTYIQTFSGSPYRLVEPNSIPCTTGQGTRSLFRFVYEFNHLQTQVLYVSYWMCQLMLVDARINITNAYQRRLDTDPTDLMHLKGLANEYADHISKSMPTMASPNAGWAGRTMAVRPLHLLLLYYKQHHQWQKLSWCVECARDIGVLVDRVAKSASVCAARSHPTRTSTRFSSPSG